MKSGEFRGASKIRIRKGIYKKKYLVKIFKWDLFKRNYNEEVRVNFLIQKNSEEIQPKMHRENPRIARERIKFSGNSEETIRKDIFIYLSLMI